MVIYFIVTLILLSNLFDFIYVRHRIGVNSEFRPHQENTASDYIFILFYTNQCDSIDTNHLIFQF